MLAQLPGEWWVFIFLGLCAGVVSGMLGLGSGIIFVPTLVFLCGFGQKSAQGTALAVMVPMVLVGAIRYWRNPEIDVNGAVVVLIALGAVAGALGGTELAARLPVGILRKCFALFLVVVAVRMFVGSSRPDETDHEMNPGRQTETQAVEDGGMNDSAARQ